jgi:hypothetical protein
MSHRALLRAQALLFAAYALLLAATAWRPVDTPDWREADIAAVARNFSRESMNPLRPRIDWRGDGDGVVEMEPPLLPYAMALLSPVAGEDVRVGRLLSLAAWLTGFAFFLALARARLAPLGAGIAGLAFALNPLGLQVATELRPEPVMLAAGIAAVYYAERWLRAGAAGDRARAGVATALAIFAKLPALWLGLLLAALALRHRGLRALRQVELWAFAALVLLPAALWYGYARTLWRATGNSLGLSNQDHLFGLDLLATASPFLGVLDTEQGLVFMPSGVLLVLAGALAGAWRRWLTLELWWLASLALYYGATAATTGEAWAAYYHVTSLPLAALLIGGSVETLLGASRVPRIAGALLLAATLVHAGSASASLALRRLPGRAEPDPLQLCAEAFARQVPSDARLLVAGGRCRDRGGRRVAHNRPYLFYWMDRKGSQPCAEALSAEPLARYDFFAAERRDLRMQDGFEAALRARYPLAAECDAAVLFDLRGPTP